MDEYADCARGCMSKCQPLFKALVVAALVGGFFVGGYSAVGGGGRAARAAPAAGPPGRSTAPWGAQAPAAPGGGGGGGGPGGGGAPPPPPPPPEGRVIPQSSGDLPGSSAWRRFVQRQGSPGSPRGAAAGAKRPEMLGRAAAGRPSQHFVWQARGQRPRAAKRRRPPLRPRHAPGDG